MEHQINFSPFSNWCFTSAFILVETITATHSFSPVKNSLSSFFYLLASNSSHHLERFHAAGIDSLLLSSSVLFKSITLNHKTDMNNSFRIIFIKISIIKVNIINIYTNKTYFITIKSDITRFFTKKTISLLEDTASSSFSIIFFCNKPIRDKFECW